MDERNKLDHADMVEMHDLFEAIIDMAGKHDTDTNVVMHALCRAIAYGGVQMTHYDKMTKNQFVANVVEAVSAHYDNMMMLSEKRRGTND